MHSGIVTEPVMALLEGGAIDAGRRRVVATMAAGSAAFYAYLDDNPQFEFLPCDATHDHATLAAIDGLTAINGALQVDLAGRVNAEMVAGRTVSAPGGLPDFARGASAARGGLSIIALRSTSRDGRHSAILPALPPGAPVTVDPEHVGCVVSEYGVARLAGCGAAQRCRALAAIAHPDFRAGLRRADA
jgi:4-hydroxybutyrate CoA-transferase